MYSYLYDNKFLLWTTIIFMFIGMITVTIILYIFFLSIVKRKKKVKRNGRAFRNSFNFEK